MAARAARGKPRPSEAQACQALGIAVRENRPKKTTVIPGPTRDPPLHTTDGANSSQYHRLVASSASSYQTTQPLDPGSSPG